MTAIRIISPLIERLDIARIAKELIGISAFEQIPGFVFVTHWLFRAEGSEAVWLLAVRNC